jgi:hypothetical protein
VALLNGDGTVSRAAEAIGAASTGLSINPSLFVDAYGAYVAVITQTGTFFNPFGRQFADGTLGALTQLNTGATGSTFDAHTARRQGILTSGLGTTSPASSLYGGGAYSTASIDSGGQLRVHISF